MTPQEQAIWNAAYAAQFTIEHDRCRRQVGFDAAEKLVSPELAISVADKAVTELRRWRDEEQVDAGFKVGDE
jgi:hypothetical protein